jgi:CubicO group peptidase (beta-lactamase class C family)
MKQILPGLILIAFFLTLWSCEKKQTNLVYDKAYIDEIKQARKEFTTFLSRNYIPGGNIAIAKENKIIYSEGFGLASKELKVPMTHKNKLRVGDVSQLFTFIIYAKLVEEGVLESDSTVQHYIKDYPKTDFKLKLKHLPYHTSGIRKADPGERELSGSNLSIQKGLEIFMHDELNSPPGWYEEVSIFNANLLGAVMEKATKKKFPQLLKEYITDTLHLTNTLVDDPIVTVEGRAEFYDQDMLGKVVNTRFQDMRYSAPSIGILSNAEDLVKLGMAILDSDYLSEDFVRKLFEPCDLYGNYKSTMANGWVLTLDKQGRDVNARSGSVNGGGAAILIYPEEKLVLAFTINLTLGNNMPLFKIANHFLKDPGINEQAKQN